MWYGTGSTDPKDFTLLEDAVVESVPYEWTRYEWTLPDGADRFAIRSCAPAGMLLMIDDVEFVAASARTLNSKVMMSGATARNLTVNRCPYSNGRIPDATRMSATCTL